MAILHRSPQNCARVFNTLILLFLIHAILLLLGLTLSSYLLIASTILGLLFLGNFGLLVYHIGHDTFIAIIWTLSLLIPLISLFSFLFLFFRAKHFLKQHDYGMTFWGAKLQPHQEDFSGQGPMLREGKFQLPDSDT